jgi:glycosyltransferase involved in cell wall biosynthesis
VRVLFIGKRHYTHRDALRERYGRIYQLPWHWAQGGTPTQLWLIDYHGLQREQAVDGKLSIDSTPMRRLGWLGKSAGIVFSRVRRNAPSHIVASGDAYIGLLGWLLARLTGACFVFDVYDKYDEFGGYRRPLGWNLFGFLLRHADRCWFASLRLLGQLGNAARGDCQVMNGIDPQHFRPLDQREARARLGLPADGSMVGYFGSLSIERGTPDLIRAMQILSTQEVAPMLVLSGKMETPIPLDLPNVRYLGNLSHDAMPWALAAVDVVAVPYRVSAFLDAASSVKFGEVLACRRPLVATRTPNFLSNFPIQAAELDAYLAEPGQPETLARAIDRQLREPVLASVPTDMEWPTIARKAWASLRACKACRRTTHTDDGMSLP